MAPGSANCSIAGVHLRHCSSLTQGRRVRVRHWLACSSELTTRSWTHASTHCLNPGAGAAAQGDAAGGVHWHPGGWCRCAATAAEVGNEGPLSCWFCAPSCNLVPSSWITFLHYVVICLPFLLCALRSAASGPDTSCSRQRLGCLACMAKASIRSTMAKPASTCCLPSSASCDAPQGQLSAIWHHSISSKEFHQLKHADFRKQVFGAAQWPCLGV